MTTDELQKMLIERPTIPLWPETGEALGYGKSRTYESAKSGEIQTIRMGAKYRVPSAWLRKMLGLDQASAA